MNAAKVMKLAPTIILVGCLGYGLFAMESGIPETAEKEAEVQKGLELMVHDVLAEGSSTAAKLEGKLRDPFRVPAARAGDCRGGGQGTRRRARDR